MKFPVVLINLQSQRNVEDLHILHFSVIMEQILFWKLSFLLFNKRSLIDFPCPKCQINCWIILNGNIYGVSIFTEYKFQKTSPKEKLEWAIEGKQVPSAVSVWVGVLMTQELLIRIVFDIKAFILHDCTLCLYEMYLFFTHGDLWYYGYKPSEFTCTQCGRMKWTLATQDVHSCATFL